MAMTYNPKYNTYIGARYVPIIYGAWDNTKQYEPLTVVTHEGNSYTSKTYVPVGVDITNPSYWVLTGNFNAQVEAMQNQLNTNTSDIGTIRSSLENIETSSIGRYVSRIDYYVSKNGNDDNDGSIAQPFLTADKAFEQANRLNGNGGSLFVHFLDAGTYIATKNVFSGMALHILGKDGVILSFDTTSNMRFYASHINISNITIQAPNTASFAVDGSSYWFVNVDFNLPKLEIVLSNGRFTNCTVNSIYADSSIISLYGIEFSGTGGTRRIDSIRSTIDVRKVNGLGEGQGMTLFYLRESKLYLATDLPVLTDGKYDYFLNTGYSELWGSADRFTGAGSQANTLVGGDTLSFYFLTSGIVNKYPTA